MEAAELQFAQAGVMELALEIAQLDP